VLLIIQFSRLTTGAGSENSEKASNTQCDTFDSNIPRKPHYHLAVARSTYISTAVRSLSIHAS